MHQRCDVSSFFTLKKYYTGHFNCVLQLLDLIRAQVMTQVSAKNSRAGIHDAA